MLQAENVEAAEPFFERTWKLVKEALELLPKELHGIKLKPAPAVRTQSRRPWLAWSALCCW